MSTNLRPLIRLPRRSYATLKALSKETKTPMSDLAAEAIERYSDARFWEEVNRNFDAWTPEQRRHHQKEFKQWEALAGETLPPELLADDWSAQIAADAAEAKARRDLVGGSRPRARTRAGRTTTRRRRVG